ncbi:hypothetical protein [Pseudomonas sp. C11]|uniref:hypothetical protein n=1 Tax=Pseudomonas sp. C11 TaxID=3075550 RepID=UPI003A52314D
MPIISRSIATPIRTGLSREATWEADDKGLIRCWETGRELAIAKPELADAAKNMELPVTNWKGGVSRTLKKLDKYGSLQYLAQWQGLRGEDLRIDPAVEVTITCSKTHMVITFTADISKLIDAPTEETAEEADQDGGSTSGVPGHTLFS